MSRPTRDDYESEQQRLKQQHGYDDGGEDDDTPVNYQLPEVNPEIYKDVEPLVLQGFLALPATINGVDFVFKSLNHHEFYKLGLINDLTKGPRAVQRYHDMVLAYGVLMVDGVTTLDDRDSYVEDLIKFFAELPPEPRQKVILHFGEVARRANRAVLLTEAYAYESRSRLRWAQVKGLDLSSTSVTGFQGTQFLGLNWAQLTWRALNNYEDQKEVVEREWEHAKFIASPSAGKGMQRVYAADKRRRQSEFEEKNERRERVIRHAIMGASLDDTTKHGPVKVARTVGELAAQLESDLKGEQDWHDKVIADHEEKMRRGLQNRMAHLQRLRDEHIEKFGDKPILMGATEFGLSQKDVNARIKERQKQIAEGLGNRGNQPDLTDPKYIEFMNKWVGQKPIVSPSKVMAPANPDRPRSKPFGGK